jgi:hypothetical protein
MSASLTGIIIFTAEVIAGAYAYWYAFKPYKPPDEPEPEPEDDALDAITLRDKLNAVTEKMNHLADLDDMLLDLQACKPDKLLKAFKMEWMSEGGNSRSMDFMADGKNMDTKNLKQLAMQRRDELNEEIISDLQEICGELWELDEDSPAE